MRFNPNFAALALAASAAVVSLGAQATSIDVKVTGTITPGACTPTLAGGGTVDYGLIGASTLRPTAFNVLPEKEVAFSIACNVPTRIAVRATDNRAASVVANATLAIGPDYPDEYNFGLNTVSGVNVGGFSMMMKLGSFTVDGNAVRLIRSSDGGTVWRNSTSPTLSKNATGRISWSPTTASTPLAFTALSGTLAVQAVLNRGSVLPLTADVPLDGSATLEMIYL